MSVVTIAKESHKNPDKFRVDFKDADSVLGPKASVPENETLPTLYTSSKVAIIGGGFAGVSAGLTLLRVNKEPDFVVFERYDEYGGTWYANTYPGCASDIPALWYSYSYELNTNWSRVQPPQYEMEEYILTVVKKYGLHKHARFRKAITKVQWDDTESNWKLYVRDLTNGQLIIHTAKIVITGHGGLVYPKQFECKGLENFKGEYMHSALWRHDVPLKGKNVIVIGNGCSANQLVPALLKDCDVKSVTQVVRSKHYIMPRVPPILYTVYSLLAFSRFGLLLVRLVVALLAELRFPLFKGDGIITNFIRKVNTAISLKYMKKQTPEKYQDIVIPDFKIGCKRMIYDYDYLPTLHDPRIDLRADPIDHITEDSVVFKNGDVVKADVIAACTGYDLNKSFYSYDIIGRNGVNIADVWRKQGPSAYETISIRDCPNLFVLGGPNSATGHASVVMAIENGSTYVSKVIPKLLDGTYKSLVVKTEKYNEWFETAQKELKKTVYGSAFGGCHSWYANEQTNSIVYPYSQITYWWRMEHPNFSDYEITLNEDKKKL
ncbi:putative flavin-containing monooxygenase [Scheffersomyces xylosifermentans]|uniref:putative flavin-containing monooxygenase n=1 Tax=Scheffersomyces xylosifermentans TaxID=1304137 RepID=UPI00315C9F8F